MKDFEGWDQDLIDEYLAAPSDELYDELEETNLVRHAEAKLYANDSLKFDELDVYDDLTGTFKKEFIAHYGTPRHSGRYPWGSGKNPQRNRNFIQRADELIAQGLSPTEVAKAFGLSSGEYRALRRKYNDEISEENQRKAVRLHDKGYSNVAIANELGVSEGTIRNYLDPTKKKRENRTANIANGLKETLKEKPYLDVGEGVNRQLGISEEALKAALVSLEDDGYNVYNYNLPQVSNPKQYTKLKILCDKDITKADLKEHLGEVTSPQGLYFEDFGETTKAQKPIPSIDSKRILVRYDEEGGGEKDGVIEIRRGTDDLWLGGRNYAQVRIGVDGTHYLKGMAVYGPEKSFKDVPEDIDVIFNTSKHVGTPVLGEGDSTVLKPMKNDPQNPFGASFRQWDYTDKDGASHVSPINIVNDDTDWDGWKKNLSSQFLSKQYPALAKQQLNLRYGEMTDEFRELKSLTNPTLKRQLLEEFADTCDSAAVHLKAAALPRQGAFAILPITSLKDNEVYAPMYDDGEEVILVRHPHESVTQIPRLIVNNRNKEGKEVIGTIHENGAPAAHAVGINAHTANQLSGADYDGDTVLVIPTKGQKLKAEKPMAGLADYNPSDYYERDPDDPICTGKSRDGKKGDGFNKGIQMGMASNLITDMTIKAAGNDEIERAIKHSMCVIDAEKHNLDWKKSYEENGIAELKRRYQLRIDEDGTEHTGASTLISRAKGPRDIDDRKEAYGSKEMTEAEYKEYKESGGTKNSFKLTPEEYERYQRGEVIYRDTGKTQKERKKVSDTSKMTQDELDRYASGEEIYRDTGRIVKKKQTIENMAYVNDAYELSSGYYIENVYADHANRMKALANEARKEARHTGLLERNPSAAEAYKDVVGKDGSLAKKIALAELEAPKERQAQLIAASVMKAKEQANPALKTKAESDKRKKLASKALENARDAVRGGNHEKRYRIELTAREWEAIQAGAISDTQFKTVLRYSDKSEIKKLALPRASTGLKSSVKSRARLMLNAGYAPSTVAKELGVSTELIKKEFKVQDEKSVGGD